MTNRKQTLALIGAAATAGFLPSRVAAQSQAIRVGVPPFEAYAEPFYAHDAGIYRRAGLDVDVEIFTNNDAATNALLGGALDVAANDAISISQAINHGLPIAILAGGALYSSSAPAMLLCVAKQSTIASAKDFEGKTLALLTLSGLSYTVTKAWLTQNGADVEKIHLIELPSPAMPPAIVRGTIAGAVVVEPVLSMARSELRVLAKPYDVVADVFQISTFITTRDWVNRNPQLARRFVAATYETARWANANPSLSLPILSKYAKIDIDKIRHMTRDKYATSMPPSQIAPLIDLAVKYRALEHGIDLAKAIVSLPTS